MFYGKALVIAKPDYTHQSHMFYRRESKRGVWNKKRNGGLSVQFARINEVGVVSPKAILRCAVQSQLSVLTSVKQLCKFCLGSKTP